MKIQIFLAISLFFFNLESVIASCEEEAQAAQKACDKANIKDPLRTLAEMQPYLKKTGATVPGVERGIKDTTAAKAQVDAFKLACANSINSCIKTCEGDSEARYSANDSAGGKSAEDAKNFCANGEPTQNQKAAEAGSGNMAEMLPALMQLLAGLKGDKGEDKGDLCSKELNNPQCKTDVAANTPTAPLTSNERTAKEDGSFLEAGMNGNDTPAMGERTAPSLAQGTPGIGGGSGINSAGLAGGGGRSKGVAEGSADDKPKINLASAGGGGGAARSSSPMGGSSTNKGGGNPIASRTSIDADNRSGAAAMDKALQARGLASEGGQLGGISAAHSFDNFQKIEKRIQVERNRLSEL